MDLLQQIEDANAKMLEDVQVRKMRRERRLKIEKKKILTMRSVMVQGKEKVDPALSVKRHMIVSEIVDTEQDYVNHLDSIVKEYIIPLREASDILSEEQVDLLFSDIESIAKVNRRFLKELGRRLEKWDMQSCIGDIFVDFAPAFESYATYINNHQSAQLALHILCGSKTIRKSSEWKHPIQVKPSKKFQQFIQQKQALLDQPLQSLLIMPIQRIPRYQLLLQEVIRKTPRSHKDFKSLEMALLAVQSIAEQINSAVRSKENSESIAKVQKQFKDPVELMEYSRMYIHEGSLHVLHVSTGKVAKRYLILFSDIVLIAKEKKRGLVLLESLTIDERFLVDDQVAQVELKQSQEDSTASMKGNYFFQVMSHEGIYHGICDSAMEKMIWISKLKEATKPVYADLLFRACRTGNMDLIQSLVTARCDLEPKERENGDTPLLQAVRYNKPNVVARLLNLDANVNAVNHDGATAVILAVTHGAASCLPLLLQQDVNVKAEDKAGYTALMNMALVDFSPWKESEAFASLVQRSDVKRSTSNGETALVLASKALNVDFIMSYLALTRDGIDQLDKLSNSALYYTVLSDRRDCLRRLVECGAEVNQRNVIHRTPLMHAAKTGHADAVEELLQLGADPALEDKSGLTAFDLAADKDVSRLFAPRVRPSVQSDLVNLDIDALLDDDEDDIDHIAEYTLYSTIRLKRKPGWTSDSEAPQDQASAHPRSSSPMESIGERAKEVYDALIPNQGCLLM